MWIDYLVGRGVFACDCLKREADVLIGILIIDPKVVTPGQVATVLDPATNNRYNLTLAVTHSPDYRVSLPVMLAQAP